MFTSSTGTVLLVLRSFVRSQSLVRATAARQAPGRSRRREQPKRRGGQTRPSVRVPGGAARFALAVVLVGAPLVAADVDAELLGGAEDVLVHLAHLDLGAVVGEHLDVEAQRLHL